MAVNFRNRVENCFDEDVGNYENNIVYMPADYQSPQLIRESLQGEHYCRAFTPQTKRYIHESFVIDQCYINCGDVFYYYCYSFTWHLYI